MPRLRNPSLKIRENLEFSTPTPPSSRGMRTSTPSGTESPIVVTQPAAAKTATAKTPSTTKRGKGRPKSTKKKPIGRPKKTKTKYEEEFDDFDYEYDSRSSSSSDNDDDDYVHRGEAVDYLVDDEPDEINSPNSKHDIVYEEGDDIVCPWVEDDIPPLTLPPSSFDIPTLNDNIMDLIEMYETLRSYSRTLKLTPFLFEDFCSAMISPENSCLLSEIHIALLRACLRSDDEEQVHYSVNDTNNAVNITFYALDSMTYAEVLRLYLESDRAKGRVPEAILASINSPNYPFVPMDIRLGVITYLCYRFLDLTDFRKIVTNNGKFIHEDVCRHCLKGGDLLNCYTCELSFHPGCHGLEVAENASFQCSLCRLNDIKGVVGCEPLDQVTNKQPLRMTPIGRDRHGRLYWFVARRIMIQDQQETTVTYYSTAPQLYELASVLDPTYYEYDLCKALCERLPDILEQMAVTLELTNERHEIVKNDLVARNRSVPPQAMLHVDNIIRMKRILHKLAHKENVQRMDEDPEYEPLPVRMEPLLGIGSEGNLVNSFWAGHLEENEVMRYEGVLSKDVQLYFVLGHMKYDDQFKKYKNHYALHEYGESLGVKKKFTDKKKYMATRFSIFEDGEDAFRWSTAKGKDMYGPERQHAKYLEWTINKLQKKIPIEMMHRRWPEVAEQWRTDLSRAETFEALRDCLLRFEACMRRTLFLSQFWSSLGLTRWTRTTPDDREQSSKENQRKKKDEKDASSPDYDDSDFIRVKYSRLPTKACPQTLWRMKDETYRLGGKGALGGWIWVSATMIREWEPLPEKPCFDIVKEDTKASAEQIKANNKARNLENIIQKLTSWRQIEEKKSIRLQSQPCYSPSCRIALSERPICEDSKCVQKCYSSDCRNWRNSSKKDLQLEKTRTAEVVKARDITRFPGKKIVRGEGSEMWPLLLPTSFKSRKAGKRSILVIHDIILRKLAKTGGHIQIYVPNFSLSAKSNYSLWNYPCPRPCFDLCWKWLTTNARSLHAVSLQLKILWYCIKWAEFMPGDDETEDGRLIVHQPDRDEIRLVIDHKEFPPQGTYERYLLQVEAVMLDDDPDDDDYDRSSSTRKKIVSNRPKRAATRHTRKTTRQEWIDGIELKIFEIRSYWERVVPRTTVEPQDVIFTKNYITAKDIYMVNNRQSLNGSSQRTSLPFGTPRISYHRFETGATGGATLSSLQRTKRVAAPPRRDDNFAYDDTEFDNMEQGTFNSGGEPPMKRARVILQPGVSVGYTPKTVPGGIANISDRNPTGSYVNGSGTRPVQIVSDSMQRVAPAAGTPGSSQIYATPRTFPRATAGGNEEKPYSSRSIAHSAQSPTIPSTSNASRQIIYSQRTPSAPNGKVLLIRKNDGTTQYLRPVIKNESSDSISGQPVRRAVPPGTVVRTITQPTKIVRIGPSGEQIVQTLPPGARIVTRAPASDNRPGSSFSMGNQTVQRPIQRFPNGVHTEQYENDVVSRVPVRVQQPYGSSRSVQHMVSRSTPISTGMRIVHVRTPSTLADQSPVYPPQQHADMDFDENFLEPPSVEQSVPDSHTEINNNPT